ncbi:hypothetical protein Tsubulata_013603 [Turnera subulata]|uniref:TORTIFOLIA1/SINE1-2 N-terminal domain-containing protein n=1 Tax=Turnera subulata TaxID=218843 RepID=A0A9Q0FUD3_9ROSI|nr:hypothetical protein Tsubulata_013603 [Turnera subulata]
MSSLKRSSSLSPIHSSPAGAASPNGGDIKHRVITCLNKLSDRDTLAVAATELESIAKSLTHDTFSPFLHCLHNTDSSSKSPVRRHCVNLLALISRSHGNLLSPHLPKILSTVSRRLRDPDSSVRSACVDASSAISSHITKPPFSAVSKPFVEILTVEQDANAQIGAALCLAAAIEAAPEPEPEQLRKLLPRLGKLAKAEGFKARAAVLAVVGSIVGVGGARGKGVLDWLVPCLVEFLSCEDWAARKAAAEALGKVAEKEKMIAREYKVTCLTALESRRFDKVKVVRETMNRALELWKEVPGVSDDLSVSVSSQSRSSSTDNTVGNGGFCPSTPKEVGFKTPTPKKTAPASRSPPSEASLVTTGRKQSPENNSKRAIFRKVDHRKPSAWRIEVSVPTDTVCGGDSERLNSGVVEPRDADNDGNPKLETKSAPSNGIRSDHKLHKFGGTRFGSRVVPYDDDYEDCYVKDVEVSSPGEELYESQKDGEDLSLIREQLIQIENQQSDLLNLLQRFMGSSQSGINSLESRVHGLEMALDEISYDLALSSGRIPNIDSAENTCCKLPGTEFLSPKFWRKTDANFPTSRLSSSGHIQSLHSTRYFPDLATGEIHNPDGQRFQHQNNNAFATNPLAGGCSLARGKTGFYASQISNNII